MIKNLDKKSIILLATLLAVAVIIIVFSQNILDKTGGNKFLYRIRNNRDNRDNRCRNIGNDNR